MDEQKLKNILSNTVTPEIDINARKRAVNLAVAAFKSAENEKNKQTPQGVSILSRLMVMSNTPKGRETMEQTTKKKLVYGGMATAMAVVFVAAISVSQLDDASRRFVSATDSTLKKVSYPASIYSEDEASLEEALRTGHAEPVPVESGKTLSVPVQPSNKQVDDPLKDWRQAQEEKMNGVSPQQSSEDPLIRWRRLEEDRRPYMPGKQESDGAEAGTKGITAGMDQAAASPQSASEAEKRDYKMGALEKSKDSEPPAAMNDQIADGKAFRRDMVVSESSSITVYTQPVDVITQSYHNVGNDKFTKFEPNAFKQVALEPVSTFSSDIDTASYSFVRRQLNNGQWPQADAVRVEEMVNYFDYNYPLPESKAEPFKPTITVIDSPWAKGKKLMHVGIKGYDITENSKPHANIVFLLDVSGSMEEPNKLPLVKASMKMLLDNLKPDDTVAITVYAGAAGTVLAPTKSSERSTILSAIDNLNAGGSTAGEAGIRLAYQLAEQNFDKEGVNRIILATDGDFNVGTSSTDELKELVEQKRESGIFLSVLGFGEGNYNDSIMQTLAQNGNGVAAYIDTLNEARKVLVEQSSSSLFTIAKDVKFQVEFNPAAVSEYRLVGYETRALNREDFNNDKIDAGDMGAGHTVTAIYEFVPVGSEAVSVDALRYATKEAAKPAEPALSNEEYAFVKIRYKLPNENTSKLITTPVTESNLVGTCAPLVKCKAAPIPQDTQFAVAVAAFAQILKNDPSIQTMTLDDVINLAEAGKGTDPFGYRAEFINLVRLAKSTRP